ncbi:MAG TPA: acetate uptake transporter [Mycobacteriales bacterium]|nr:acetate uptake transporter [Mycobacteriales bacterium]
MAETTAVQPAAQPVALPTVADPAPLGLAGFAMTTLILSLHNTNTWAAGAFSAISLALAYGGGAQLLAGMWEFKRNNTFGATAFSSYGAFWIAFWYLNVHGGFTAADGPVVVGTFLLGWCIFTFYMTIASLRTNGAVFVVFALLTITFVLLTIGAFHSSPTATVPDGMTKAGGWFGVATAAAAWYASFAGVTNTTFGRPLIPVWPLTRP